MTRLQMASFCAIALGLSLGVCALLFPFAAMTRADVASAKLAQPMEAFESINLGEDYGEISVFELIGYYLDNPPSPEALAAAAETKHFGGC